MGEPGGATTTVTVLRKASKHRKLKTAPAPAAAPPTRIGVDFGMTIADCEDRDRRPFDGAFPTLHAIVNRFGAGNCFIVSKAKSETSAKILQWFEEFNFYAATGFLRSNVHFVRDYGDKRIMVDELKLSMFIDDSVKVVKCIVDAVSMNRVVWFRGSQQALKSEIPRQSRGKIVISKTWNKLYKVFAKPCITR